MTAKLLTHRSQYHKFRNAVCKYHHRLRVTVKYNIAFRTLLQQGISEPLFYGDLDYKFKRIVGKSNLSDQFKNTIKRYKIKVGYSMDIMGKSA